MSKNNLLPEGLTYTWDDKLLTINVDEKLWERVYDKYGFFEGFREKEQVEDKE